MRNTTEVVNFVFIVFLIYFELEKKFLFLLDRLYLKSTGM